MRIAVTGAYGQLGGELCRQLGRDALPLEIDTLDLTDGPAVMEKLGELGPELVVNCAAYTQVDRAQHEPEACRAVNATAVEHLARACEEVDCPLVQISTDYVFGGAAGRERPYREDAPPSPQGVYARTKLDGERAAARHAKHLIVRTCGLYARPTDVRANHFVKTMLRLGCGHDELRVVADQRCTPSYVPHVARAVLYLAGVSGSGPAPWGIYHVTNRGETTWYEFAVEIFRQAGLEVSVRPITTAEYAAAAPRPAYSVLDTGAYHALGGPAMPDWKAAVAEYMAQRETTAGGESVER
ncbi:MAG: dTDP-4-dehydrorhamnose reductase [Planctomycetes bacterium RBG_13_63_9]|nr:MAG: dTDP-4-dehydrorhamnose reductase [Planctomycetes bacterium RBG_13_63_9]